MGVCESSGREAGDGLDADDLTTPSLDERTLESEAIDCGLRISEAKILSRRAVAAGFDQAEWDELLHTHVSKIPTDVEKPASPDQPKPKRNVRVQKEKAPITAPSTASAPVISKQPQPAVAAAEVPKPAATAAEEPKPAVAATEEPKPATEEWVVVQEDADEVTIKPRPDEDALETDALAIFNAADINGDGEIDIKELNDYIVAHPEGLSAVTELGAPRWGDLMQLFQHDSNGDGMIQRDEWASYYISRVLQLESKALADQLQSEVLNGHHSKTVRWDQTDAAQKAGKDALLIFRAADANNDGELDIKELGQYINDHPEALADICAPTEPQWGDLMSLFQHDSNGDGMIQDSEWVSYYVARVEELQARKDASTVQAKVHLRLE
eukprot:TRINITY_DN6158_c0_g1_i1.p1 TRINITY_DN6158_c0_g1~~TRINITY_DN6158_c0_g1_i1.p1  ORF type:complete len:383 (-),score=76.59 TRINITY_DN6158_c0_g1_i1:335-1483(-)